MEQIGQIPQLVVAGITSGCIYAIVAIGFTIIYNSTGVINFAQGEFVMIGAMVAAVVGPRLGLAASLPVAVAAGALAGLLLALCLVIPLKRASVVTLIIITVGASILMRGVAQLLWGESAISVQPFSGVHVGDYVEDRSFSLLGAVVEAQELWVVAATLLLVAGMGLFFRRTLIGQAMRACEMNPQGARLTGINVNRMLLLSFAMAAAIGAVAGLTVAPVFYAKYNMGTGLGLKGFCAAVMGGLGDFRGGVIAGILLGIIESIAGGLLWSDYREAIAFVILLAILFLRPQGLLARRDSSR